MNISLGTPTACLPYACRGLERFARFNSWNPHKNYEVDTLATHFTDEVTGAKELSGLPKGTQLLTALPGLVQLMGSRGHLCKCYEGTDHGDSVSCPVH